MKGGGSRLNVNIHKPRSALIRIENKVLPSAAPPNRRPRPPPPPAAACCDSSTHQACTEPAARPAWPALHGHRRRRRKLCLRGSVGAGPRRGSGVPAPPHRAGLPPGDGGAARILPAQAVGKGREGGREEGTGWEMHMVAPRSREGRGRPGRGGRAGLGWARPAKLRAVGKAGAPRPSRPSRVPGPTRSSGVEGVVLHVAALVRRKLLRLDRAERKARKP